MLLPALGKARDRARTANCISNLKQCATAAIMYSNDNSDLMVLIGQAFYSPIIGATSSYWGAVLTRNGYLTVGEPCVYCPTTRESESFDWNTALQFSYATHINESGKTAWGRGPYSSRVFVAGPVTANINCTGATGDTMEQYLALNKVSSASNLFYNTGSGDTQYNDGYIADSGNAFAIWGWSHTINARHSEKVNLNFADGHAATMSPEEISKMMMNNPDYNDSAIFVAGAKFKNSKFQNGQKQ